MEKKLVMYSRTLGCHFISIAGKTLAEYDIGFREIYIDKDDDARQFVRDWTGYLSVPTLIVANDGENVPYAKPSPLKSGESPRGIDRGSMITEATREQLITWLRQHGFIEE